MCLYVLSKFDWIFHFRAPANYLSLLCTFYATNIYVKLKILGWLSNFQFSAFLVLCSCSVLNIVMNIALFVKEIAKKKKKIRSSHWRCSVRKGVLRNFVQFTGKHLFQSLIFDKVARMRPATLLKMRLWHRCFPVNFTKFLRAPFLQNTSGRLLLKTARKKVKIVALFEV